MAKQSRSIENVKTSLEIEEQLGWHQRGWVVQRVGWVILGLVMLAGLLGLFGEGLLSEQKLKTEIASLQYEKYFRYESEMAIRLESRDHIASVAFPQAYLKNFRIVRMVPEPLSNSSSAEDVIYHFQPGQNRILSIYLVPKNYGRIQGGVKLNGTTDLRLSHYIFP